MRFLQIFLTLSLLPLVCPGEEAKRNPRKVLFFDLGKPLVSLDDGKGFEFENSVPLKTDNTLNHSLKWEDGADLTTALNQPVRLEIKLRQARIYSLRMTHHFLDAHDMRLLQNGKPLPENPRFDF